MTIDEYRELVDGSKILKTVSVLVTDVDARVRTGLMAVCQHAGHEFNPEGTVRCPHFDKASTAKRCMYYREDLEGGGCDCPK